MCPFARISGKCYEKYDKGLLFYTSFRGCSDKMISLPGIDLLPTWLLGVMWGLMLTWLFFGVMVISDTFVETVEVITSTEHVVKRVDEDGNIVYRKEPVWNWAVANISLLAVGTSSPEILLSIIEALLTLDKAPGAIGAACIVGSAAYNLCGITMVIIAVLPAGTLKKVKHQKVFIWTTAWSFWTYMWLWLVYKKISPNFIDIWEAFVTLGMFPVFLFTTWLVDTRGWNWFGRNKNQIVPSNQGENDEEKGETQSVRSEKPTSSLGGGSMRADKRPSASGNETKKSILYYRHMAIQNILGGKAKEVEEAKEINIETTINMDEVEAMGKSNPKILFKCVEMSVLESVGKAKIEVIRMHGDLNSTIHVKYETCDDTAIAGLDFEGQEGFLTFNPGETTKEIMISIMDDDMSEPDVVFSVVLVSAEIDYNGKGPTLALDAKKSVDSPRPGLRTMSGTRGASQKFSDVDVKILRRRCFVTIVDDDDGGILAFELPTIAGAADSHAEILVRRRNGADGNVSIDYATKDGTASSGVHFKASKGVLSFASGETTQVIQIPLLPFGSSSLVPGQLTFKLSLSNPLGGVMLGQRKECRVVIVPGAKLSGKTLAERVKEEDEGEEYDLWHEWRARFKDAVLPASPDDEGGMWISLFLHYVSVTFKIITAFVPPPEWRGGYPALGASLVVLAGLMAVVVEVAEAFGCAVGLSDLMTGISIVAMGTSLPDTFASVVATINAGADEGIGNVMGSNCANVLLGLGIPFVICACYYAAKNQPYVVIAGSLGFCVMIYNIVAVSAVSMMLYMRSKGGELGSPNLSWKIFLVLFYLSLWLIFLILSGLLDYGHFPDPGF